MTTLARHRAPRAQVVRPVSVWPLPDDAPDDVPDPWLLPAVETTVAIWTRPGQSVLLLALAGHEPSPAPDLERGEPGGPPPDLFAASAAVVRLGRRVRTATSRRTCLTPPQSGSGLGPRPTCAPESGPSPDPADLVVTTTTTSGWKLLADTSWAELVRPDGLLAVITHGHISARVSERTTYSATGTRDAGLVPVDEVVLLDSRAHGNRLANSSHRHALLRIFAATGRITDGLRECL